MSELTLYHGSQVIVNRPVFGKGSEKNDYGLGFYCTEELELAKEWACGTKNGGFANVYSIDTSDLKILHLDAPEYGILEWLAVLVNNRVISRNSPIVTEGKEYLTEHFLPDISKFDAIRGYRADDSYFAFAFDFLSNTISLRQLSRAMRFGKLGYQFVLKSQKAFDTIRFVESIPVDGSVYYVKRTDRDRQAKEQYLKREKTSARVADDVFMLDILREEMKHGDARLQ